MCLEEVAGAHCVRPADCSHYFCRSCVAGQAGVHVAEGALDALRCPDPQCRAPFLRQVRRDARLRCWGLHPGSKCSQRLAPWTRCSNSQCRAF